MGTGLSNPIIGTDPASPIIAIGLTNTKTSPTVPSGATGPISPIGPTSLIVATGLTNLVAGTSPAVPSGVTGPNDPTNPRGPSSQRGHPRNRSAEPFRRSGGALTHRHRGPSRDVRLRPRAVSRGSSRSVSPRKKNHAPNPSSSGASRDRDSRASAPDRSPARPGALVFASPTQGLDRCDTAWRCCCLRCSPS